MTTRGQKLLAAIHEVAAHERGEIQLNTVSVPIKSVTDWREAAELAQSRIADLEAENADLKRKLEEARTLLQGIVDTAADMARAALEGTK